VIKYDATDDDGQTNQKKMQPETNEKGMVVPHTDSIEDQAGDLVQHMISIKARTCKSDLDNSLEGSLQQAASVLFANSQPIQNVPYFARTTCDSTLLGPRPTSR
jgi:hypothetical protein